jgi:hypothetical protein
MTSPNSGETTGKKRLVVNAFVKMCKSIQAAVLVNRITAKADMYKLRQWPPISGALC